MTLIHTAWGVLELCDRGFACGQGDGCTERHVELCIDRGVDDQLRAGGSETSVAPSARR